MFDKDGEIYIIDFGGASICDDTNQNCQPAKDKQRGTKGLMSPEMWGVEKNSPINSSSDIFTFGIFAIDLLNMNYLSKLADGVTLVKRVDKLANFNYDNLSELEKFIDDQLKNTAFQDLSDVLKVILLRRNALGLIQLRELKTKICLRH